MRTEFGQLMFFLSSYVTKVPFLILNIIKKVYKKVFICSIGTSHQGTDPVHLLNIYDILLANIVSSRKVRIKTLMLKMRDLKDNLPFMFLLVQGDWQPNEICWQY